MDYGSNCQLGWLGYPTNTKFLYVPLQSNNIQPMDENKMGVSI